MSANPAHYNTADRLRFEQYAEALRAAGAGLGPFPGLPPPGYRESFRLSQRFAPVPEDYPSLFGTPEQHAAVPNSTSADVAMSTAAFSPMLDSQRNFVQSVLLQTMDQARAVPLGGSRPAYHRQPTYVHGYHRGRNYSRGIGGRGAPFGGRGGGAGGRNLVDRVGDRGARAGGPRFESKKTHRRNLKYKRTEDIESTIAEDGSADEMDADQDAVMINADDIPEEGEFDEDVDNGFNAATGL
ncbi:hypothetical protein DFH09DRAFT_1440443 [Mycena vulgaris]|nr:hypothetical protein DFH09DRAFT_1440443 [Mycena vulgaris]